MKTRCLRWCNVKDKMLSILIPTFNYDSVPLVKELHKQCVGCDIEFEILVYDDGSKSALNSINHSINRLQNCTFKELPNNIGRSAIRNLLAKNAKYDLLLFVDTDTFPKKKNYIKNYINTQADVVNGSVICTENPSKKPFKLRWLYTKFRERNALCSSNFLIRKAVFEKFPFDETIKTYGYEDVLFFETLQKSSIAVLKIDNPVIHASEDSATTFIKKTEFAINNLISLIQCEKLDARTVKASLLYKKLETFKLVGVTIAFFKVSKWLLIKNFNSSYPSLFLFDFYRLGYFCTLKKNKS